MPKDICVHPMTTAAYVSHAWNVNSASGICKISAKQMLEPRPTIHFLQQRPMQLRTEKGLHTITVTLFFFLVVRRPSAHFDLF